MIRNSKIYIALFIFFALVAIGAILMLDGNGSVFSASRQSAGAQKAVVSEAVIGEEPAPAPEPVYEEPVLPEEPEPDLEESLLDEIEPLPDPEPMISENDIEKPVEDVKPGIRYFSFVTNTQQTILRLREEPSEDAAILKKLTKNTPGFILKPGNDWCREVMPTGITGYCSTEYLVITEITADDFPADFVDQVEAPDEELGPNFDQSGI